ncbi:MAG: electron transfer flavoprotein subunit alpha [Nitrospirae bacterium CG18_big_fil_WC_8_21_14_2_50_70_55]|nr:electron transfer flavoprotein subunit alpha/FixB family protein [Deltaproteobacteria bacterium]OIP61966.1 MAG: hypothetical protein AUK30_10930 [Nitrospirae bacterium CG2_30_70_394]PIQ05748.1 MAG: electron transfer flavoprotein subunit alpha [Nitrospirae bacterium CG18_big_fil_WC_8_21_14_2_50_70_55]PIU77367.1 MAG: electron transfer flavoprotein subunit alpha/FixB family protein [Nitrospirae bacterium CG06_land_8_20_14_3_00_70_43]PIW83148.1 MAG: electron transfer flavoprotein subunit alpha/F
MEILILAEAHDGALHRMTRETVAAAQALARDTHLTTALVVLGAAPNAVADAAATLEADELLVATDPLLASGDSDLMAEAICQVVRAEHPTYLLAGHTYRARDLFPRVSARLAVPLLADVVAYEMATEGPRFIKPMFNGRLRAALVPNTARPVIVTFQAAAYAPDAARPGTPPRRDLTLTLDPARARCQREAPVAPATGETVDLSGAERIVAVGRGLGSVENLPVVRDLAKALGAELACSRPVVDAGWLPQSRQVGSSGQTVAPKLYLALGISGATQHLVGMKGSAHVVAVNKDPEAPIFDLAEYGVVGDLLEVAPKLTERLRA